MNEFGSSYKMKIYESYELWKTSNECMKVFYMIFKHVLGSVAWDESLETGLNNYYKTLLKFKPF